MNSSIHVDGSIFRSHRLRGWRAVAPVLLLIAAFLFGTPTIASAQSGPDVDSAYADWLADYGSWTRADVEAAGYVVDPACVKAADMGLPAELGAMGFHAVHLDYAQSGELDPERPHVILLNGDDEVIGVEYEAPTVMDPAPEIVPGLALEFAPPHPGMDHEHMARHIYFVGDAADRYGSWNPAVSCPADMESTMAHADDGDDDDEDGDDDNVGHADSSAATHAPAMPEAGAGDLIPGGTTGLLLLLALVMGTAAALGARGARTSAKR